MNRLPRIAVFVSKNLNGVNLWRTVRPWTDLHRAGAVEVDFHYETFNEHDSYRYDVIYFAHAHHETFYKLIEAAHLGGTLVWADLDDDLLAVPIHNQATHTIRKNHKPALEILRRANIVSCSTPEIADKYGQHTAAQPIVLPNAIHPQEIADKWNDNAKVLWRGNWSQIRDMWCNKADHDRLQKHMNLAYIGAVPPWVDEPSWTEWGPTHSYLRAMRKTGVGHIWKPLEDNEFNRAKSNIAMLEGAIAGALTICNLKHGRWKPAISSMEAVDRDAKWKQDRFEKMREFITEHYNAATIADLRYNHLIKHLQ